MSARWLLPGLAALAACTAVLGIERLPPGTSQDDAGAVVFTYAEPRCESCIAAECAAAEEACRGAPDCAGLYQCLVQCLPDDLACRATCAESHPYGVVDAAAVALDGCRRGPCLDQCLGAVGLPFGVSEAACQACLDDRCADQQRACIADARCEEMVACSRTCTDPECPLHCYFDLLGQRLAAVDDFKECVGTCTLACLAGRRWDCVGAFSWGLPAAAGEIALETSWAELSLAGPTGGPPIAGLQVDVCAAGPGCDVLSSATTDDAGLVTSQLLMSVYSGFVGHLQTSGRGTFPQRFYFGRPITRGEQQMLFAFASPEVAYTLTAVVGQPLDPTLGLVMGVVYDCATFFAPGLTVTLDPDGEVAGQTAVVYDIEGGTTTAEGLGIYVVINAVPGWRTVTAWRGETAVGHTTAWVEADSATFVLIFPEPIAQ